MSAPVFEPSALQQAIFAWVRDGSGCAIIDAVAGSGKSTTIVRTLPCIPEREPVVVLAFSALIAREMKRKVEALEAEMVEAGACSPGRFRNVRVCTFHSLGFGALCKLWGLPASKVETDKNKLKRLASQLWGEETQAAYGDFATELCALAKGRGVGAICADEEQLWWDLAEHHDVELGTEQATVAKGVAYARELLAASNRAAKERRHIDFHDQLYLPLLWGLRLFSQSWVFIDEAQDTNDVRRAVAKLALRAGGRLVAVGDPYQAIFGFTGASHDAMDLIQRQFNAVTLPLNVSYRCPRIAESMVRRIVPHFRASDAAMRGEQLTLDLPEALARLGDQDVIVCRNTAPLIELAYRIIGQGRGCAVLGSEIGQNLVALINRMQARGVDALLEKLAEYRDREVARHVARGQEGKAERVTDRVACLATIVGQLRENERTVPALVRRIDDLFSDGSQRLTLCTGHKAKGREWLRVGLLAPELMPSKWARQDWQYQQELNLEYVVKTRFMETFITIRTEDRR